mmetsp:Transcript_18972/g.57350  ORF Transcript_18972/g.57350 Transcript_18972/m.57350 type:complete len:262 (-) Transcript_18972:2133-2918(-)|eukprot:scaffold233583_cov28-Tisochrysis_lutea.AAC.5
MKEHFINRRDPLIDGRGTCAETPLKPPANIPRTRSLTRKGFDGGSVVSTRLLAPSSRTTRAMAAGSIVLAKRFLDFVGQRLAHGPDALPLEVPTRRRTRAELWREVTGRGSTGVAHADAAGRLLSGGMQRGQGGQGLQLCTTRRPQLELAAWSTRTFSRIAHWSASASRALCRSCVDASSSQHSCGSSERALASARSSQRCAGSRSSRRRLNLVSATSGRCEALSESQPLTSSRSSVPAWLAASASSHSSVTAAEPASETC